MQGLLSLACLNRSRTRDAPTPTNISTKSEPEIEKNGTSASPAMALASSVLPVPGSPTSSTPRGMRPPRRWNFFGFLRNSTISITSSLASSMPATSSKVTLVCSLEVILCRAAAKVAEHAARAGAIAKLAEDEEPDEAEDQNPGDQRHEHLDDQVLAVADLDLGSAAIVGQPLQHVEIDHVLLHGRAELGRLVWCCGVVFAGELIAFDGDRCALCRRSSSPSGRSRSRLSSRPAAGEAGRRA